SPPLAPLVACTPHLPPPRSPVPTRRSSVRPSLAEPGPLRVTVGATLPTATSIELTLLLAPSLSCTWTLTVLVAGPSLNVTSKLPVPVAELIITLLTTPTLPPLVACRLSVRPHSSLALTA